MALLQVAAQSLQNNQERSSLCRLSTMTGVHRRDATRIYRDAQPKSNPRSLLGRIVVQWQQDPRFRTKQGKPKVLSIEGEDSDFKKLVTSITHDIAPGTVLIELERSGSVKRVRDGVKLENRIFMPSADLESGFAMLSRDLECLIWAVEENLLKSGKSPHLHISTIFDRISAEDEKEIREWLTREGSALHQKARNYLAKFDRDIHPELAAKGEEIRVFLNCFTLLADSQADVTMRRSKPSR